MTEREFVAKNKEKWQELEQMLTRKNKDADLIHDLFIKVSSDLSYARTFFPNRSVRQYLNNLTKAVFDSISINERKFSFKDIIYFFKHTLPVEVYRNRKAFYTSLAVFVLALCIGIISSANNPEFPTVILGQEYIDMTEANINKDDPMAVYKDAAQMEMFLGITINNVRVSFMAFVLGLLGSVGTIFLLMYNGIMVGAFQYYFYSKGLFLTSFLTIWIHGTIEISAIIIAGAAGIILGNGLLFPRTYNRTTALQISARKAITIVMGTFPLFIIAGLLESFVTRHTGLPDFIKWLIIILSAVFILLMFVVYPYLYNKSLENGSKDFELSPPREENINLEKYELRSVGEGLAHSFARYRELIMSYIGNFVFPSILVSGLAFWVYILLRSNSDESFVNSLLDEPTMSLYSYDYGGFTMFLFYSFTVALSMLYIHMRQDKVTPSLLSFLKYIKQYFITTFLISIVIVAPVFFLNGWWIVVAYCFITPQYFIYLHEQIINEEAFSISSLIAGFSFSFAHYFSYILPLFMAVTMYYLYQIATSVGSGGIISDFLKWHQFFEDPYLNAFFIGEWLIYTAVIILFPLVYYLFAIPYYSAQCQTNALDLASRLERFGRHSEIFES